jgi:hypothetical protein
MDINLIDMLGSKAALIMREIEREYDAKHTIITAVSVEGHNKVMVDNIFDGYSNNNIINLNLVEKPIKSEDLNVHISNHFKTNRPDIKFH